MNKQPNNLDRLVIYAKDIQRALDLTSSSAQKHLQKVRRRLKKPRYGYVTIKEYCAVTGMSEEELRARLCG